MLLCALTGAPVPPSAWRQRAQPSPAGSGEHLGAGTRHPATMDESGGRAGRRIAAELLMKSGLEICLRTMGNKSSQNRGGKPGELIG